MGLRALICLQVRPCCLGVVTLLGDAYHGWLLHPHRHSDGAFRAWSIPRGTTIMGRLATSIVQLNSRPTHSFRPNTLYSTNECLQTNYSAMGVSLSLSSPSLLSPGPSSCCTWFTIASRNACIGFWCTCVWLVGAVN